MYEIKLSAVKLLNVEQHGGLVIEKGQGRFACQ